MKLKCYKCFHEWDYRGIAREKKNLTCPNCLYKIRYDKAIVGNLPNEIEKEIPTNQELPTREKDPYANPDLVEDKFGRVWKFPEGTFKKKIVSPETEFVETAAEEISESGEEFFFEETETKLCAEHNLPARYLEMEKKWVCEVCAELENYPEEDLKIKSWLPRSREVKSSIKINPIPYNPIKHLRHMKEHG